MRLYALAVYLFLYLPIAVIAIFSFNAGTGATFIAAAVPEPGEWAMMLAGLLVMGSVARRRNAARKV